MQTTASDHEVIDAINQIERWMCEGRSADIISTCEAVVGWLKANRRRPVGDVEWPKPLPGTPSGVVNAMGTMAQAWSEAGTPRFGARNTTRDANPLAEVGPSAEAGPAMRWEVRCRRVDAEGTMAERGLVLDPGWEPFAFTPPSSLWLRKRVS